MAHATYTQSNFQGGHYSGSAQGRLDLPQYRTALARCQNAYPIEAGAITRRPGTRLGGPTFRGVPATLIPFKLAQNQQYVVEITVDGIVGTARYWLDGHIVCDTNPPHITAISTATPAVITVSSPQSWAGGSEIVILIDPTGIPAANATMWSQLANRTFVVTAISSTQYGLFDTVTGFAVNGSGFTGALPATMIAGHIRSNGTNFNQPNELPFARYAQAENQLFVFGGSTGTFTRQPQVVQVVTNVSGADPTFSWGYVNFVDGPYLNPVTNDLAATISGTSGTVTFTVGSIGGINNGTGFSATDIGRYIRFYITPPVWNSGTTYSATGSTVRYPGNSTGSDFVSINGGVTNLNLQPDINKASWAPLANHDQWGYGTITAINSTSSVQVALVGTLFANTPLIQYALSLFTNTNSDWPTVGAYFEGRMYLGGGNLSNILVASQVGGVAPGAVIMSPTDTFGNVRDTDGIFYTVLGQGHNTTYWMIPDNAGIILGTQSSEWIVQSGQTSNGVITPSSIQIHQTTRYGSSYSQAIKPGIAVLFLDRYNNTMQEFLLDPFSQKYGARPLNFLAQDITSGMFLLEYQSVPNPMVWVLGNEGLVGCLYRRVSYFASEMPVMYGWHSHAIADGEFSTSYITNAATAGTGSNVDQLYLAGKYTGNSIGSFVLTLTPPFMDTDSLTNAFFVDLGSTGINLNSMPLRYDGLWGVEDAGLQNMIISGLWYHAGNSVSALLGGLDFGDHTVQPNGYITVAYGSDTEGFGTRSYLQSIAVSPNTPGAIPINMSGHVFWIPGVVGLDYTTTIQKMRPDHQEDARTPNGPAATLRKRHFWYGLQMAASIANDIMISGDTNDTFFPIALDNDKTGLPTPTTQLFTGTWRDTIESDFNLDGQMVITLNRPTPMTITQITGFMETEEI